MVKPVKFTRDSGCLARDEFLVISEGDHMVIHVYKFVIFLLLGTVLYFRLFRKNLGNLREFFGQMVHCPQWQNIARTPMHLSEMSILN